MRTVECDFNCIADDGSYWGINQDDIDVGDIVILSNDKVSYPAVIVESKYTHDGKPWLNAVILVDR